MNTLDSIKGTDIYLLDQIMKGRYQTNHKILDAGCGQGRNMCWFANSGFDIYGSDLDNEALLLARKNTMLPEEKFSWCPLEDLSHADASFDHVICNAVLHFAQSEDHFTRMVSEMGRVLKQGGSLFIRMTSVFGLPRNYQPTFNGRYLLQDGTERFLLTTVLLERVKKEFGFRQLEPVKSVLVEELRSMTTLLLEKC